MNINTSGEFDIIVVGGGIAGVSAAVSAARCGKNVLLIEKSVNLGGLATNGLISWFEPLCDGNGNQMIFGICEELIQLAIEYCFDTLPVSWGGKNKERQRYASKFSPTVFSLALDEYVISNGVKLRFDTYATYPVMERNHCSGVICESIGGREFFKADVVIDATGDASISQRAGIPTVPGENFLTYVAHMLDKESCRPDKDTDSIRKWESVGSDMLGNGHPKDMPKIICNSADDITEFMLNGKLRLLERLKKKDRNSFDIMTMPSIPQLRTIRRIVGAKDFNATDGMEFKDSIGSCGDFRPSGVGKHYQIPYGALYNPEFDNILACGRIISAPAGDGWEVARVIPTCALTGEAAGKAAAAAIKQNCAVADIKL